MLLTIENVLDDAGVVAMQQALRQAEWHDGTATAGLQSRMVKNNRQLPEASTLANELGERILQALSEHPLFLSAALPLKIFPPLFNRYAVGQGFGTHVDNAIRWVNGNVTRVRTDLSATLFLSQPDDYDGGELVIEDSYGTQAVKLAAGDMLLYPSTSLHHVRDISRGERISSFFWMQSMVRDNTQRALLFDLDQSVQQLGQSLGLGDTEVVRLTGIYHNLMRQWADT